MFDAWPAVSRTFATDRLSLLRRLPLALCPSFAKQMHVLNTSFPAEVASLQSQCDQLAAMPAETLNPLLLPFEQLRLSSELTNMDWLKDPDTFMAAFSAWLWSSGQVDEFRTASHALFAAIAQRETPPHRLVVVVVGRGVASPPTRPFARLRKHGVLLTSLQPETLPQQLCNAFREHAATLASHYAHWYVDGGEPWTQGLEKLPATVAVSYPELAPLRTRMLANMEATISEGNAGAEKMRANMGGITPADLRADELTPDPVLQRFYTELFTLSSGPQLFSTSFVQWTGRELLRRAQPRTLLLRYAPRQRNRAFNDLLAGKEATALDPEGSLIDAEMGAYYTWLEMNRISAQGNSTFVAWREGTGTAVIAGKNAPQGTVSSTPLTLEKALLLFA
ncbi:hypothetical protein D1Y84_01540 [Acidipila sp. EB88]|nr:hypothetical protein D1Y84_01540 [Acidipila sp. EB88]